MLGAHNLSGFVAYDSSGLGRPTGRLEEPDGGAGRGADSEVWGAVGGMAVEADNAGGAGRGAGDERAEFRRWRQTKTGHVHLLLTTGDLDVDASSGGIYLPRLLPLGATPPV